MNLLEIADVDKIAAILVQATDPTRQATLIERKRDLIEQVAVWLDVDVFITRFVDPQNSFQTILRNSAMLVRGYSIR